MGHPLPGLVRPGEIITLKEAVFRAGKNGKTIRRWCTEDGIGRRTLRCAPREISAAALEAKRCGGEEATEALRRGEFTSSCVRRGVDHPGVEP